MEPSMLSFGGFVGEAGLVTENGTARWVERRCQKGYGQSVDDPGNATIDAYA